MPVEAKVAAILRADMAGFAEPGDDQPALGVANEIGGGGKRRAEIGLQRRGDRGDAAAFGLERTQGRLNGGVRGFGPG